MAKTPTIRMEEFAGEWEFFRLDEKVNFYSGLTYTPDDVVERDGTLVLRSSNIQSSEIVTEDNVYVNNEVVNSDNVRIGDIVVVVRNGSKALIGKHAEVKSEMPNTVIGAFMTGIRTQNPSFVNALLSTPAFGEEVRKNMGATINQITGSMFKSMEFYFPDDAEQKTIGNLFNNIDNLIALHQKKLDKLGLTKKAMLRKMFPQNGATVPEIRFKEFSGEWEYRQFGEVFEEYSEKNHEELPALMVVQGGGTILRDESSRKLSYDKQSLKNYKLVNENDFILHLRSFEGGLEIASRQGIISPAYHVFHGENTCSSFYYPFFRSKQFISVLLKPHVYGIRDGKSIDINGMKTIIIPVPSLEEQKKIGEFFVSLNKVITLQEAKIEKLKKTKKALLSKMFV